MYRCRRKAGRGTYETTVGRILSHADNVAETPGEHLAARVVVVCCLQALADAERLNHAACSGLLRSRRVDVGLRATSHQNRVWAPFGRGDGASRVRPLEGHTRHDLLACPHLAGAGIIGVRCDAGEIGREERLPVSTKSDSVVCLHPKFL